MPVSVFAVGCLFGMETYNPKTLVNMIVVTIGVIIASYGEINFVVIGVLLQLASVATESTRLMLIQILLQRRGLSLNPVTTMYYIAPASFLFLSVPFAVVSLTQKHDKICTYCRLDPLDALYQPLILSMLSLLGNDTIFQPSSSCLMQGYFDEFW